MAKRWLYLIILPIILMLIPTPTGLTDGAWRLFAIYCGAILGLVIRPANEAIVLMAAIAVASVTYVAPVEVLLSGFASPTTWLVFSAFLISQAFTETGLGRRLAFIMLGYLGKSSLGLLYGETITDYLISPATPSSTARSGGIVYPIFRSVATTLGSEPGPTGRKIGSYLTLTSHSVGMSTGALFITACAPNALAVAFGKSILHLDISWMLWAISFFVPGMLVLLAVPYIVYKLYPPEIKRIESAGEISRKGLKEMGALSSKEKTLIVLFVLAIIGWATGHITKISATSVALAFFSACIVLKLMSWENILANKGAWTTLIWYGAIMGLSDALAKVNFFSWMARTTMENVTLTGYNTYVVLLALVVISLGVRYIFGAQGPYTVTFMPVLFTIGLAANAPAMPLFLLIAGSACYGCMLTNYGGGLGPVLFGTGYVDQKTWWTVGLYLCIFNVAVYMLIGLPYWKLLGLW